MKISEQYIDIGPFLTLPMGSRIYKIQYKVNGVVEIGWVRLGFNEKWKL